MLKRLGTADSVERTLSWELEIGFEAWFYWGLTIVKLGAAEEAGAGEAGKAGEAG